MNGLVCNEESNENGWYVQRTHVVCGTHTGIDEAHVPRVWDLVHILEGII